MPRRTTDDALEFRREIPLSIIPFHLLISFSYIGPAITQDSMDTLPPSPLRASANEGNVTETASHP